jgi:hypothetical protein
VDSSCRTDVVVQPSAQGFQGGSEDQRLQGSSEPLWSNVKGQEDLLFFRQGGELKYWWRDSRRGKGPILRKLKLLPIEGTSYFAVPSQGGCRLYDHFQGHFVMICTDTASEGDRLVVGPLISSRNTRSESWSRLQRAGVYCWRLTRGLPFTSTSRNAPRQ